MFNSIFMIRKQTFLLHLYIAPDATHTSATLLVQRLGFLEQLLVSFYVTIMLIPSHTACYIFRIELNNVKFPILLSDFKYNQMLICELCKINMIKFKVVICLDDFMLYYTVYPSSFLPF